MKRVRFFYPAFRDDMDLSSLAQALENNLLYLKRLEPGHLFHYGSNQVTCRQVLEGQLELLDMISKKPDARTLNRWIRKHFYVYRATGRTGNPHVLFTGYFEPEYQGSLAPDEIFQYPLYKKPEDLIRIDLSLFSERFKGENIYARIDDNRVLPYYSRQEIEEEGALKGRGLEIAWLKDPVDVAFLQIQGSGRLKLQDEKTVRVGYAGKNGRPYRPIGRYLLDKGFLERSEISMQAIRGYLLDNPAINDEVLNYNPSYTFFRMLGEGPIVGNINVPITPGRSIALDARLFPKGALAFIASSKPELDEQGGIAGWEDFSRFALVQDTGGAIRGAGRADIFWGSGDYAALAAGHMKHEGDLYILIKKPSPKKGK